MILFIIWRLIDFSFAYLSTIFIPYLGFFPYKEIFIDYKLPIFISGFASFDGAQYLIIVREGYNQLTQAYFPLYPIIVKFVSLIFLNNHLLAGLFISNICFFIGLLFFNKYLSLRADITSHQQTIVFLLLFPTSFFFGALYTEGLFFLLVILALWGLKKEKYWLVAMVGFLAALTRLVGVFLIIPIVFHLISQYQISKIKDQSHSLKVKNKKNTHALRFSNFIRFLTTNYYLLAPLLGLLTYTTYLWKTTGDPLFFFNTQPMFGANRSTHLIFLPQVYYRYVKIFITASPNFQYFISVFEFLVFNFSLFVLILCFIDNWPKFKGKSFHLLLSTDNGLLLFSFINLLLPTLTGTFSSIPRYALMSLSVFIYLGAIQRRWIKVMIACLFGTLHIICLGLFIQGYFVG